MLRGGNSTENTFGTMRSQFFIPDERSSIFPILEEKKLSRYLNGQFLKAINQDIN